MKVVKRKEKLNQKEAAFVPQFLELLNKPDNEAKYKSSLEDMKQALTLLDKKLQSDLETLRLDYERERVSIDNNLSKRGI